MAAMLRSSLLLLRSVARTCAHQTRRCIPHTRSANAMLPGLLRHYSAPSRRLEECLTKELKLERKSMVEVPIVSGFEVSYVGSLATLTHKHNDETVNVEVDANHAVEVLPEGEADDDVEPFFVPAFTVSITKPSGSSLRLECSFDEGGSYNEQGNEWENLRIDSVCVIPSEASDDATIYTADAQFLSDELMEAIKDYLQQRGINQRFASEIITFYQNFEHHNYVNNFLAGVHKFLTS